MGLFFPSCCSAERRRLTKPRPVHSETERTLGREDTSALIAKFCRSSHEVCMVALGLSKDPPAQVRPTPTWTTKRITPSQDRPSGRCDCRRTDKMANQSAADRKACAPVVRDTCHGEPQTRNGVAPLHHRMMEQIVLQTRPPARRSDKLSRSRFSGRSTSPHSPHHPVFLNPAQRSQLSLIVAALVSAAVAAAGLRKGQCSIRRSTKTSVVSSVLRLALQIKTTRASWSVTASFILWQNGSGTGQIAASTFRVRRAFITHT